MDITITEYQRFECATMSDFHIHGYREFIGVYKASILERWVGQQALRIKALCPFHILYF